MPHLVREEASPKPDEKSEDGAPSPEAREAVEEAATPSAPSADATVVDDGSPIHESSEEPDRDTAPRDLTRYRIRSGGGARNIESGNAPNIRLRVERGLTVDARHRKNYDAQTIFLDGVYAGAPFLDNEARHYSLDHHAGCVRAFTLSTCEQAVVMLLQGLPLSSGMWTVYVNDPDLDSMLAAWVLLNHVDLLNDDKALLKRIMPLIRLEGVIDGHGTERALLTGFSEEVQAEVRGQIDDLMSEERELKGEGAWPSIDFVEYARAQLERVDAGLLPIEVLERLAETQESGRASLANGRIGVLLASGEGIYAVEERLKERYGSDLGVIVLQTAPGVYTLRLCDAFLRKDLTAVYRALNKIDPKASSGGENPNLWGGSGDIGGSPRASGTGLEGDQILEVLESVLGEQPPWYAKLWRFVKGLFGDSHAKLPPPH